SSFGAIGFPPLEMGCMAHMQPCPSARTGVASARVKRSGRGITRPAQARQKKMLHQKISRARKVGETRSEPLCARGAEPLSNGFEFRICEMRSLPEWAETRADAKRRTIVKRGSVSAPTRSERPR